MRARLNLESFDAAEDDLPAGPPPSYEDGYATGLEAGRAESRSAQAALTAEISETLSDMAFTHAEARRSVLAELRPLFVALIEEVLPAAGAASLGPKLIEALMARAEADSTAPLILLVSGADIAGLTPLLAGRADLPVTFEADPTLGPGQALLGAAGCQSLIDLSEVVTDLQQALAALCADEEGLLAHG